MMLYLNDVPTPYSTYFQDSASPAMEGIIELHDTIMFYIILITTLTCWMITVAVVNHNEYNNKFAMKYMNHGMVLEIVWTIFPCLVLLMIASPSFILLYLNDEVITPAMTVKAIGYQWYWSYELSDFLNIYDGTTIEFDSYLLNDEMLEMGQIRWLDTDTWLYLPTNTHVRFIVTSMDVIHDFAVPSLGLKIDANPGRLNMTSTIINRNGVFYGMCSELCGVGHSMMPIKIESVDVDTFLTNIMDY
uniref:Cytochrome c oxidase subunit 2 n=1 Tax=Hanseniaspora uvarum TaxID=29833 RepID=Q2LMN1_HANUV|nr:cytochrome oxidase subunit II [Hanseniaspora uvarum]AAY46315.1 cytochrome oxidase subunit II [Hanseniaspora uvarum]